MRKLNGITINGEYLGNSVVINGMFRAICTISPVIMRDFISIINKIDALEEAVKIYNFNCGFDSIDIEFENKNFKGVASLYFKLIEGQPVLTDCKLVIGDQVFSTIAQKDKITVKQPNVATNTISPNSVNDDLERKRRINEIKERKLEKLKQQAEQRKQRANAAPNPNMSKTTPIRDNRDGRINDARREVPKEQLTPEQQRKQKLQELLEKRRKAKQGAGPGADNQLSSANSDAGSVEKGLSDSSSSEISKTDALDLANGTTQRSGDNLPNSVSDSKDGIDGDKLAPNGSAEQAQTNDAASNESGINNQITNQSGNAPENSDAVSQDTNAYSHNDSYDNDYADENGYDAQYGDSEDSYYNETYDEFGDNQFDSSSKPMLDINDFTDEELENLSDEELAELEAQLEAENSFDNSYDYSNDGFSDYGDSSQGSFSAQGFGDDFAEKLSRGLSEGLTQGLSQGLTQGFQGLFQGLSQNMGNGFGNGYNNMTPPMGDTGAFGPQMPAAPAPQPVEEVYDDTSDDSFYDMDAISDIYSDFYSSDESVEGEATAETDIVPDEQLSEIEMLKAELENLKSQADEKKELMTLDEYKLKQQQLKDAMEQKRRQKFKIVGSKEHVNASALEGGVFVAGNKVYKWGETRYLDG